MCLLKGVFSSYSKKVNNRTGGATNEYRVVLVVLVFSGPGSGFLVLVAVVAGHYVYYH